MMMMMMMMDSCMAAATALNPTGASSRSLSPRGRGGGG
jgi:hypothetical protein